MTAMLIDMTEYPDGPHRISGPVELLQAVPYLLGFHPYLSIVLVGLADGTLVVTARLDLADTAAPGLLSKTIAAMAAGGSDELVAVIYPETNGHAEGWTGFALSVQAMAELHEVECGDVLSVVGGRWRSLLCTSPYCCPPDGKPLPDGVSSFAAAATVAGVVPMHDRGALERTLDPLPEPDRQALLPAVVAATEATERAVADAQFDRHQRAVKRRLFAAARAMARATESVRDDVPDHPAGARSKRAALDPGQPVDDATAAQFAVALRDPVLRNAVWMAIDDGRLEGRSLWLDLARRLPRPYDAVPLFLYGWATWRSGNGALASMAATRAAAADPEFTPALLLIAALDQAVDPRRLPRLRAGRSVRTA